MPKPAKLPIRQQLSSLTALKAGPKAVLIEVCELYENGRDGCCAAKNKHFVERLGATERTITRALTILEQQHLLIVTGKGKARRLTPKATVRACYAADEHGQCVAIAALNLVKKNDQPRQNGEISEACNLDKNGSEPRQNRSTNLDKSGSEPRQNRSRVYRDEQDEQINEQDEQPPTPMGWVRVEELELLQKKIALLEVELTVFKAKEIAAPNPVAPTPSPVDDAELVLPPDDPAEARAFVPEMAKRWHISQQLNAQGWRKLTAFALAVAAQGKLVYLRHQFAGFDAYFSDGLTPHNLEKFCGHDGQSPPYSLGTWCSEGDWAAKAKDRRRPATGTQPETPARASASPSTQKRDWR